MSYVIKINIIIYVSVRSFCHFLRQILDYNNLNTLSCSKKTIKKLINKNLFYDFNTINNLKKKKFIKRKITRRKIV